MTNNPLIQVLEALTVPDEPANELLSAMATPSAEATFPESNKVTVKKWVGVPAVNIGDKFSYVNSTKTIAVGEIKGKKITTKVEAVEDEWDSIQAGRQNTIADQRIRNMNYKDQQILRFLHGKLAVAGDEDYDSEAVGAWGLSSVGTLTDPSDLNSTAGTEEDLTSTIALYGAAKSTDVIALMTTAIRQAFTKHDYYTKMGFANLPLTLTGNRMAIDILKTNHNLLATNAVDPRSYFESLVSMGFRIIIDDSFDETDPTDEDAEVHFKVIGGLNQFQLMTSKKVIPWTEIPGSSGGKQTFSYVERTRSFVAVNVPSLPMKTSSSATNYTFYKPVFIFKVKGYNAS